MLKKVKFPLVILLVATTFSGLSAKKISAKVLQVKGSDTIVVSTSKGKRTLKLMGVRILPKNEVLMRLRFIKGSLEEKKRILAYSNKARQFIPRMLERKDKIKIEATKHRDHLNMPLYYAWAKNGTFVNLAAIRQGYSNLVDTGRVKKKYRKAFKKALKLADKEQEGMYKLWQRENTLLNRGKNVELKYASQKKVTLMTINTENLFDTQKEPGKNDYTFLPKELKTFESHKKYCSFRKRDREECEKLDWNKQKLDLKMKRLADTVFQVNNGEGPDILYLQEVENYGVLRDWRNRYLKKGRYGIVHIESLDKRGIDVAILSRLKLAEMPRYHRIKLKEGFETRGILEATFYMPNKEKITSLAIHFPAQFASTSTRIQALQVLNRLREGLPKDRIVVASGDSNISSKEDKEDKIFDKYSKKYFQVSHHVGCKTCKGTSHYEYTKPAYQWSFFDVFLFTTNIEPSGSSAWKADYGSVRIADKAPHQVNDDGTPKRFKYPDFAGVSDHFPLVMDIVLR